jgi:hypothetical protein
MHLLLESHENRSTPAGIAISLVIHSVLVFLVVAAYRSVPDRPGLADQFVTFLVPPDRPAAREGTADQAWGGDQTEETGESGQNSGAGLGTGRLVADSGDADKPLTVSIDLPSLLGDSILTEIEVDSAVKRYEWSAAPEYPRSLLEQEIQGHAFVIYVVDTTGMADTTSFQVVNATHQDFAAAVKRALPKMRFRPALLGGIKVRQLVQQNFAFRIQPPDTVLPPRGTPAKVPPPPQVPPPGQ